MTCGDRGISVWDLVAGWPAVAGVTGDKRTKDFSDQWSPWVIGGNRGSPALTGDEIGDKISAPKITKDLGELGVHCGVLSD